MATVQEVIQWGRNKVWRFAGVELIGATSATVDVTLTSGMGRFVDINATAGAFAITLPADPYEGMTWQFSERAGLATAVDIDPGAKAINGVVGPVVMNLAYAQLTLRYNGTGWIIVGRVT